MVEPVSLNCRRAWTSLVPLQISIASDENRRMRQQSQPHRWRTAALRAGSSLAYKFGIRPWLRPIYLTRLIRVQAAHHP